MDRNSRCPTASRTGQGRACRRHRASAGERRHRREQMSEAGRRRHHEQVTERLELKDVADRAGVSLELAEAMADEGVFQRGVDELDAGSVRRAMLLSVCIEAGIPLETIGQAMRDGYVSLAVLERQYYARWGERLDTTWADLAAQQGIPFDVLQQMYAAIGFAPPQPEDHPRTDEPDLIAAGGVILRTGVDPQMLFRVLRGYGEKFRRIAPAENRLWAPPLRASAPPGR